jgi:hypothetical protein
MNTSVRKLIAFPLTAVPMSALAQASPGVPGSYYIVFGGGTAFGLLLGYLLCKYWCSKKRSHDSTK